jgi:F-type H+-transporting ATPase subunit a
MSMHGHGNDGTMTPVKPGLRERWRRLAAHPVFLIAALVVGIGLLFGAPLLAQHEEPDSAAAVQAGEGHVAGEHAGQPAAEGEVLGTEGVEEPGAHESAAEEAEAAEEGTIHPPTLVGIVAAAFEGHQVHDWHEARNPVARALMHFLPAIYSLFVIIILCTVCIAGARRMEMIPGPLQNLVEMALEGLDNFVAGILGPEGRRFIPFLGTLFLYIYVQNIFGLIPLMFTPTSVLDTTLAMAICVFLYVQWVGFQMNGIMGYVRHLAGDPKDMIGWVLSPLMLPLHVVGELAKPVSLSLRLFGNMMGEETLLAVFIGLGISVMAALHVPVIGIPFHVPFIFLALITTLVQALVFFLLATIYFALVLPHEEHEEEEHPGAMEHQVGGH